MPKILVFKKEKVEREFFYKEGNSTVKWTVTQYHAKNERAAPKTHTPNLPEVACIALGTSSGPHLSYRSN